ncbi:MAG TPA: endonuclease MutS2 [Bacteroidetes bacterium]|nr:endonuclease MutS2 [Bacteroidota bacterium]
MIYPAAFEEKTGFSRIRAMLGEKCLSSLGEEKVEAMAFMTDPEEVRKELHKVDECRRLLAEGDGFPSDHYADLRPAFARTRAEGSHFTREELLALRQSQETVRAMRSFLLKKRDPETPEMAALARQTVLYPMVTRLIDQVLDRKGAIKDKASPELARIRSEMAAKHREVSARMQQLLKKSIQDGWVDPDTSLSIRQGRLVIPVPAGHKRMIRGMVHDESSTGKTVYIEPAAVVELNNDLVELEYAERREVVRILVELTSRLRPYTEDLAENYVFLGEVDFARARALLAEEIGGVLPLVKDRPAMGWREAIHPLLLLNFRKEGKEVVPLTITLTEQKRILVISGPNAGGKSVCLQTVGLLQYMLQCGLLVPMQEDSETGLFRQIFIDIGDEQSIENDLSTYSSHLTNMKYFMKHAGSSTLVLIDEFGTGTEPQLGGSIAEAILGRLLELGTYGVITTHYTNLKHFAASAEGAENGAMLFDNHAMRPLFRLEIGKPGSSFAFEIARKIGLPEDILEKASSKVGEDHVEFDRHLKDIVRDKRYWEKKRARIRQMEKQLEQTLGRYVQEMKTTEQSRKEILEKAREEAREILDGANRNIENTIRMIREAQAEKEATRKARREMEEKRKRMLEEDDPLTDRVKKRIATLEKERQQLGRRTGSVTGKPAGRKEREAASAGFQPGDLVKMTGHDTVGEVLDRNGRSILVRFGQMITTLDEKKLQKVSEEEYRRQSRQQGGASDQGFNLMERKLRFHPEKDVRGMRGEEALQAVMQFIDEAVMVGAGEVRILHGKGDGILRRLIRDYLAGVDLVRSCRDEHVERGGAGITIVELE